MLLPKLHEFASHCLFGTAQFRYPVDHVVYEMITVQVIQYHQFERLNCAFMKYKLLFDPVPNFFVFDYLVMLSFSDGLPPRTQTGGQIHPEAEP